MVEVTEAELIRLFEGIQGYRGDEHGAMARAAIAAMTAASPPVKGMEVEQIIAAVMSFVSVVDGATLLDVTGVRIALAALRNSPSARSD